MGIPTRLKLWLLCVLTGIAAAGNCPGHGGCSVRQLGSPQYATLLLQCNDASCQSAIFAPSPNLVCLVRSSVGSNGGSTVRVSLNSCSQFNGGTTGYFLQGANVVPSTSGLTAQSTVFQDTSCGTICEAIEVVTYTSSGGTLVAQNSQVSTSSYASCSQGFYVYPNIIPFDACSQIGPTSSAPTLLANARGLAGPAGQRGPAGPIGPSSPNELARRGTPPKRQCPSQTRQRVLLTITDSVSVFAVGAPEQLSDGSFRLPIVAQINGEVFYAQKYLSQAVGASQTVELVTAYTFQLARSRKYLVADVLDDTTLNLAGPNSTGLNLMDASEFPAGYATTADYRFFVSYNVTVGVVNATVFCPLFHRNYCILPAVSGYLRLTLIRRTDFSLEPTFVNPTDLELWNFVSSNSSHPRLVGLWHVALRFI